MKINTLKKWWEENFKEIVFLILIGTFLYQVAKIAYINLFLSPSLIFFIVYGISIKVLHLKTIVSLIVISICALMVVFANLFTYEFIAKNSGEIIYYVLILMLLQKIFYFIKLP